jgi:ATP dependent DNA ligase domain
MRQYTPMAPTLVREPFNRAGWVYEEKVDGWRIIAYKDRDAVRLVSRNGVDHTPRFRDIAAAVTFYDSVLVSTRSWKSSRRSRPVARGIVLTTEGCYDIIPPPLEVELRGSKE